MRTQSEIELAYREGRSLLRSFNKNITVNTTAGISLDLSGVSGNPVAQYFLGSTGESTQMSYTLNDKGLDHGNLMPGYTKYLHNVMLQTVTAALAPCTLMILDYLMFYAFNSMDTGLQTLTNSVSLPRYSATDGVQIMLVEQNPYVGGATVQLGYTNQNGIAGRLTPVITLNTSASIGSVATSAPTSLGVCGNLIPLQTGDYGVQQVDTIEFFSGDVGTVAIVLVKPIAALSIYETTSPSDWDLWNHLGYLPEIKDDAYLNMVIKPSANGTGAVTNTIFGNITTIWKQN